MKSRFAILMLAITVSAHGGEYYWEDFKTRNAESNMPYAYSTAICEDESGFDSARNGSFGWYWVKISLAEFCRLAHQHRDNSCDYRKSKSLRDVWNTTEHCHERDRLTAGCRSSRWMQDKFYRCKNINPELEAERARETAERKRIYEEWKKEVVAKKKNLLVETEPYRKELHRKIDQNERLEWERRKAYEKMVDEATKAKATIAAFEKFQDALLSDMNAAFDAYDTQAASIQTTMKADADETEKMAAMAKATIDATLSPEVTVAALKDLELRNTQQLSESTVCVEPRSLEVLMKMRRLVGKMNSLIGTYESRVKHLGLPSRFSDFQSLVAANLNELSSAVGRRGDVFGKDAVVLEMRPEVCGVMMQLPALIGARRSQAATAATNVELGSLATDFTKRIDAAVKKMTVDRQVLEANHYLVSIEGTFQSQVNRGHVTEALATEAGANSSLSLMLENLKDSGLASDKLAELEGNAQALKTRLAAGKTALISFTTLRSRLQVRLQSLVVKMASTGQSVTNTELERTRWKETIVNPIAARLGQSYVTRIAPVVTSLDQAIAYDGALAQSENEIANFVNEAETQGGTP